MLPQLTPASIKDRIENELNIDPGVEESVYKECRAEVNDFFSFVKKIMNTLKLIREHAEKMVETKEACNSRTKVLIDVMANYEIDGLSKFTDQDENKLIVQNPADNELRNKCEGMTRELSNTFKDFYYWIRGEMSDAEAVLDAINGKERLFQAKLKLEARK